MNNVLKTKFGNAKIKNGYYHITSSKEGNYNKKLHKLIFEDYHKCTILPNVDCHHINGNKTDNTITNLTLMYHFDHSRYHNTGDGNPRARKGVKLSDETKRKISEGNKGKKLKPHPHITEGGLSPQGKKRYRLMVNSKCVASSTDKQKLEHYITTNKFENISRPHNYNIDPELLIEYFESGKTMQEIADMMGCSRRTIGRRLSNIYSTSELREFKRKSISKKKTNNFRVDLPSPNELQELRKTHTIKELAEMFSCSEKTIYDRSKGR